MTSETQLRFQQIGYNLDLSAAAQLIEFLFSQKELQAGYGEELTGHLSR